MAVILIVCEEWLKVERKELENYMLEQLPENLNKSEGTVVRDVISAVAAGIVKAKEIEAKELVDGVLKELGKQLHNQSLTKGLG